jgi:uncharacterized protein (DUF2267 family)
MEELEWDDRDKSYQALRVTLHTLRDRLPIEQAAKLGAQLPLLIRGAFYEGWSPSGKPAPLRKKEDFVAEIGKAFAGDPRVSPEAVGRAVFHVMSKHVSEGEIKDVKGNLPESIRELWS